MSELGVGYVSIVPKFASGFKKSIEGELDGSISSVEKKGSASFGRMFGGVGKLAAVAAGAVTTAFGAAKVFGGGMSRLMGIEEAQAKMRGLGHDAGSVDTIMANALASVKGTSFGMAEAATTAAGAVAAGIKPGADLERVLKSVTNSAAAAGIGMGEMGSIYNKVASMGKAQNDSLQQVADRGIPIYQALADQLGVTSEEVFKMASAGKISFAQFESAMTQAAGTVASEMGTTLSGSIANLNSALGRIGANFLGGVFPLFAPALQSLTGWLGGVEDKAKDVGTAFGGWVTGSAVPAVQAISGAIGGFLGEISTGWNTPVTQAYRMGDALSETARRASAVRDMFDGVKDRITTAMTQAEAAVVAGAGKLNAALGGTALGGVTGLVSTISQMWPGLLDGLREQLNKALDWVKDFASGFIAGFGGLDAIKDAFAGILPLVTGPLGLVRAAILDNLDIGAIVGGIDVDAGGLGEKIGAMLGPIVTGIGDLAKVLVSGISGLVAALLPVALEVGGALVTMGGGLLTGLVPVVSDLVTNLLPILADVIGNLAPVISDVLGVLGPLVTTLIGVLAPAVMDLVGAVFPPLMSILDTVATGIGALVAAVAPLVTALLDLLVPVIGDLVGVLTPVIGVLLELVDMVLAIVVPAITAFVDVLVAVLVPVIEALTPIISTVFGFIADTISNVMGVIQGVIRVVTGIIKGDWDQVWSGIKQIFSSIWDQIKSIVTTAVNLVQAAIQAAWTMVKSVTETVFNGVVGFITGIPDRFMAGLAALSQLAGKAAEWFLGFVNAAKTKFTEAVDFVRTIPSKILGALGDLGSYLKNSGSALINGFTEGIKAGFNKAKDAVAGGLAKIRDFFPFSPAKKGPFSGKGYTTHSGKKLLEDFGVGITAGQAKAVAAGEKAMAALAKGFEGGKSKASKAAAANAKKIATANAKAAEEIDKAYAAVVKKIQAAQVNVAKVLSRDYWAAVSGTAKQATSMLNKIVDELNKVGIPKTSALAKYVTTERDNLAKILATRDQVAAKIKTATASLTKLIDDQNKFVESVHEKAFNLGAIFETDATATDMVQGLKDQIKATAEFNKSLTALRKMGISDNLLEQFAQQGVEKGGAAAKALLAGGKDAVKQVNDLEKQLNSESKKLASSLGSQLYDAGINAAKGLVAGLQSQQSALVKQAQALAVAIHKAIKDELQIKSPSRVLRADGSDAGAGLTLGLRDQLDATEKAARALAAAAVPDLAPFTVPSSAGAISSRGQAPVSVMQNFTLQVPDWVRDVDTWLRFLRSLGLRAHQMRGAEG